MRSQTKKTRPAKAIGKVVRESPSNCRPNVKQSAEKPREPPSNMEKEFLNDHLYLASRLQGVASTSQDSVLEI